MSLTQANRPAAISTPLGEDVLLLRRMTVTEELGRLFEFNLDLLSEDQNINIPAILGQNITVRLELPSGATRYFNGYVSRFLYSGTSGRLALYQATVHPWLWFLTRTSDCRIFQEKTVPDIIKEIFREHGFTDFEERLSETYRTWEYCAQYRETDFNFVSRLMEQEGIYYYFTHESDKHKLVLSDSYSSHDSITDYERIPYHPPEETGRLEHEHISEWVVSQQIQPGAYTLDDFDFTRPRADLTVRSTETREHAQSDYEIYDYPGEYLQTDDGDSYVRARIEELQAQHERLQGQGNARGVAAGGLFELTGYPREDQNREYLVVSATHYVQVGGYESHDGQAGPVYNGSLVAIAARQPYRSPRITPKPAVQGPQTAMVVGKDGEEIWTDEYGRVKLHFHWDRATDVAGEDRSCWIRVSQVHAGKGFGGIDIPRIGEEVIVEFLEGDPDRPIVTGRIYNGDNRPPNDLPSAGMVSGLKSNTTPGGGGNNAMMMDDTKGKEAVTIHGQHDMNTTVENDQTCTVHNNRTTTIDVDDAETVGSNQTLSVGGNQTVNIKGTREETVTGAETITIESSRTENVTGSENVTIDAATTHTINADYTRDVSGNYTLTASSNIKTDAGGKWEGLGGTKAIVSAPDIKIEGTTKIQIVCGASSITLEPAKISISSGSGNIDVHAPGVDVKGGKIQLN